MAGTARTRFASVRFGNILGSNGSVAGIFAKQIEQGGPVTLTDRRMTRFVMGLEQAVRLVLRATELCVGGELFVLKMPALRIADLAEVMIRRLAPQHGHRPEAIQMVEIGCKPGEKLYEELLMDAEVGHAYEDDELIAYVGEEPEAEALVHRPYLSAMHPANDLYGSERVGLMSTTEIETFLEEIGVLSASTTTRAAA
jgi:FlaA1/EpsC-like NDP-sugar epimerase